MYTKSAGVAAGTTTLAATGVNVGWAIMSAMLLVALGTALMRLAPRSEE